MLGTWLSRMIEHRPRAYKVGAAALLLALGLLVFFVVGYRGRNVAKPASAADVQGCTRVISSGGSVQGLVDSLRPGETGCLRGGTYTGDVTPSVSGSPGAPITLASYPGQRATIVGILWIPVRSDYITVANLNIVGTSEQSISVQLFGDHATLVHDDITNNHQSGSCITIGDYGGRWAAMVDDTTIEANSIHDCGMASDGPYDHGIYIAGSEGAVISDNLIWGIRDGWGIQLWTSSQHSLIEHNVLDDAYSGGMVIAGADISNTFQPSSNNTIKYNIITWPQTGYAVTGYWQNSATGTGNTVTSNCLYGAPSGALDTTDGGFTHTANTIANPQYINRAAHNYALQPNSPCLPTIGYDTTTTIRPG